MCEELGISKATVYQYVASNGDLREAGRKLMGDEMTTLEELERRVDALEQSRPGDLRRAVEKLGELLEDTRLRMTKVEARLEGVSTALALLTASQAEMRGELNARIDATNAKIDAVRNELKTDIAGLRRDMPGIVVEAMREVLRNNRG